MMGKNGATALYYCRARYFDPVLQRFVNQDPAQADLNLYRYCGNMPTDATDPSGLVIMSHCPISKYIDKYVSGASEVKGQNYQGGLYYTYSMPHGGYGRGNALIAEILMRMMKSDWVFLVAGAADGSCLKNIEKQVEARVNVVDTTKQVNIRFGGQNFKVSDYIKMAPVSAFAALNNSGTLAGCRNTTALVFFAGGGAEAGSRPFISSSDLVPGDWAYIENRADTTASQFRLHPPGWHDLNWAGGYEGENVIYVGSDLFWGFGNSQLSSLPWQVENEAGWFEDIRHWKSQDNRQHGDPAWMQSVPVRYPTAGLDNRSDFPWSSSGLK